MQQVRIYNMSNRSEKKLKNQEKIREESHQLEFQESSTHPKTLQYIRIHAK